MTREKACLSVLAMSVVLASTIVTLTGFRIFGVAHGQSNTTTAASLTPQQRATICDPSNPKLNFVNTTESKICGIPKTITNTSSSSPTEANNTATGLQTPGVAPPMPAP